MHFNQVKALILPVVLLTMLGACHSGYNPRAYATPAGYSPAYDPCQVAGRGCGRQASVSVASGRFCPPGYRLVRMSYRLHGNSARDCVPAAPRQIYRHAGGPPYGISSRGCCDGYDRVVTTRSAPRYARGTGCCY